MVYQLNLNGGTNRRSKFNLNRDTNGKSTNSGAIGAVPGTCNLIRTVRKIDKLRSTGKDWKNSDDDYNLSGLTCGLELERSDSSRREPVFF